MSHPKAACGGPIALLRDGDIVMVRAAHRQLAVDLSDAELEERRAAWRPPPPREGTAGLLAKYAAQVQSAHVGRDYIMSGHVSKGNCFSFPFQQCVVSLSS